MASDQQFVDEICESVAGAGVVSARKMFGEYALYCDGKVVGLICDNQLFLKNIPAAVKGLGDAVLAPPYPGAKDHLLVDNLEDTEMLTRVVARIAAVLPAPKPKTPKASKRGG